MGNEIDIYEDLNKPVPFGKYAGQPVSVLATDPSYCSWLLSQDGIKRKYPIIYNLIVNNFTKPEDTPEHNQLQAKFLDMIFVKKCLWLVDENVFPDKKEECQSGFMEYEFRGWDVCLSNLLSYGQHENIRRNFYFELKPEIGDDYPSVMREMNAHLNYSFSNGLRTFNDSIDKNDCCLIYAKYTGIGIDEIQMRKMFAVSGFHVLSLADVDRLDEQCFADRGNIDFGF